MNNNYLNDNCGLFCYNDSSYPLEQQQHNQQEQSSQFQRIDSFSTNCDIEKINAIASELINKKISFLCVDETEQLLKKLEMPQFLAPVPSMDLFQIDEIKEKETKIENKAIRLLKTRQTKQERSHQK
jgi:hypothetical protein